MTRRFTLAAFLFSLAVACSGSNGVLVGKRSDGVTVECVPQESQDDVFACDPEVPGEDECESYDDGAPVLILWPPNHKLHTITVDDCAALIGECSTEENTDSFVGVDWRVAAVTADEPVDVGAGGDGHTTNYDMAILDDLTVELRSERQGGSDGRVYRIELTNELDEFAVCEVHVPHDQSGGPFGGAIDSGEAVRVDAP